MSRNKTTVFIVGNEAVMRKALLHLVEITVRSFHVRLSCFSLFTI